MNPGPVSRCLVRRVLHSLLETSVSQLDRIGQELNKSVAFSQQNIGKQQENDVQTTTEDGNVKYLCENLKLHYNHLVWILNCTVNVLIYSRMFTHNYCSFFWLAKLFLIRFIQ
ncbi:unnamed protein product [Schistosoma mattheei]|uniref:Uncharacterized protein n=1 Tax=Schistosoma mattheei TaxID=31246 RepID=A0A3P7Y9W4_9TREM|nr:unnamed protein product [Schistosoma mattheei]